MSARDRLATKPWLIQYQAGVPSDLTAYEVPRIVEFRSDPLPKSSIGKILRRELRHADAAPAATQTPVTVA